MSTMQTPTHTGGAQTPPKPADEFPKTMYERSPLPPFFKPVVVKSADDAKPQKGRPPLFATAQAAEAYAAPEPQPIDHIERTQNEEQFDERKSQAGRQIPAGIIQTQPPVQNVYVRMGVDTTTSSLTAVLPEGVDASVLTTVAIPGAQMTPVAHDDAKAQKPAAQNAPQAHHL
jgi:hypothetical protein